MIKIILNLAQHILLSLGTSEICWKKKEDIRSGWIKVKLSVQCEEEKVFDEGELDEARKT